VLWSDGEAKFAYDPEKDSLTIDYGDGMTVVYERSGNSVENCGGDPYPMRKFLAPGLCD